eukprot:COSAG05_NODE_461_length_9571_cov_14.935283_1_plen_734_part_00
MMPRASLVFIARGLLILGLCAYAHADVYMHAPRGSNNRVNEQNTNRNNNNRLFDSQNNNKGGYSVGVDAADYTAKGAAIPPQGPVMNGNPTAGITVKTLGFADNNLGRRRRAQDVINIGGTAAVTANGYNEPPVEVATGTEFPIEWTSQHACGPNDKTMCEIVLQYMCDAKSPDEGAPGLRDGTNTGCPNNNDQCPPLTNDEDTNANTNEPQYGQHEPVLWYQQCRARNRNKGLFTADRNMNNRNRARHTRQNPNGNRSGTECPEERDYYPYWLPTPWRDIAVLTSNVSRCSYYIANSQNTLAKGKCADVSAATKLECDGLGAQWLEGKSWDELDEDGEPAPVCMESFWNRDNHLGNGAGGQPNIYNWTVPTAVTGLRDAANENYKEFDRCVIRLRYNITTGDTGLDLDTSIAFWDLDSKYNGNDSPVEQDQPVDVPAAQAIGGVNDGGDVTGAIRTLQLALNTNQYGRVFEDRSMVFHIVDFDERNRRRRRLQQVADPKLNPDGSSTKYEEDKDNCDVTHNLEIRGKRGNIVQAYPSVEHDFEPTPLIAETGDCIHFQMSLTDNDPPNNAGEGLPGSGRANVALTETGDKNVPVVDFNSETAKPYELFENEAQMFRWSYLGQEHLRQTDGTTPTCLAESQIADNNNEQNVRNCGKLNPVGPYYDAGLVETKNAGQWSFMSTRENNFSNRGHKGQLIVVDGLGSGEVVLIALGGVVGAGLLGAAAFTFYKCVP